ncbi:MAG: DUF4372 domain-containing protein [Acidobacteria bacterium]|nr:DUF4372 domain-containing protein [Acidobacteriota bacterium]
MNSEPLKLRSFAFCIPSGSLVDNGGLHAGRFVFSELIAHLPHKEFQKCVAHYDHGPVPRKFSYWDQYLAMAFAKLTYCESLRNIEACLRSVTGKLYHLLNCWLVLFNREPQADATELRHTTLATSRLRFLFVAAKIWRHAGRTGVSYSDHYEEKGVFQRLMERLRRIAPRAQSHAPVMLPALRCRPFERRA